MKRLSLTLLCSSALLTTGCFNKDKSTTDPSEAAQAADAGAGEGEEQAANKPSRASASTTVRGAGDKSGGRVKTFEAPEPPRTAVVVPGAIDIPTELTVGEVRPSMAPTGSAVEIFGGGFGKDPAAIQLMNDRTPWKVTEVYDDRIVAISAGGGSGALNVTVGKQSGATSNKFTTLGGDESFESASPDLHGLIGTVYKGDGELPDDFSSLEALGTIGLSKLSFSGKAASDFEMGMSSYTIRFAGSVNVTDEGEYELCLESDGLSRLLIMDTLVVENDGTGGGGCELVYLEAGEYDIAAEYAHRSGEATFNLAWGFDGADKAAVPADQLFRP